MTPALAAFVGSLLLSVVAIEFDPILGRDSALYVDIAHKAVRDGYQATFSQFDWPWFSMLIGTVHRVTGIPLIASALILNALLMASTCAALTRASVRLQPASGWWACLVVLSIPAYNEYRAAVLREPGFWLFLSLALNFGLAMASDQLHKVGRGVASALAVGLAALFRLEAVFFLAAVALCLSATKRKPAPGGRAAMVGILLCGILFAIAVALIFNIEQPRISGYAQLLSPDALWSKFLTDSQKLADNVLEKYSENQSPVILAGGYLAAIVLDALVIAGPFALLLFVRRAQLRDLAPGTLRLIFSSAIMYLGILLVFFIQHNFMISRYVATLHLLITPLMAVLMWDWARGHPRVAKVFVVIAVLTALSNVVSLSAKRTHYTEAAHWFIEHSSPNDRIFFDDPRLSFYSQRGYQNGVRGEDPEATFADYDLLALEDVSPGDPIHHSAAQAGFKRIENFSNGDGRNVVIYHRIQNAIIERSSVPEATKRNP